VEEAWLLLSTATCMGHKGVGLGEAGPGRQGPAGDLGLCSLVLLLFPILLLLQDPSTVLTSVPFPTIHPVCGIALCLAL
jgi:hypothetical protein